jgi:hypothetical protein
MFGTGHCEAPWSARLGSSVVRLSRTMEDKCEADPVGDR